MSMVTLSTKGQVTIPKKIRERLNLHSGDTLHFEIETDNKIVITPAKRDPEKVYGMLYQEGKESLSIEDMEAGVAEYFKNKYRAE